jgi:hypothetical protein
MALAPEPVEFALKRVDRSRQIVMITIVALLVAILFSLLHLMSLAVRNPSAGASKVLYVAVAAQMLFTAVCAGLLAFHVTRMTKSVLRAIDLAQGGNR